MTEDAKLEGKLTSEDAKLEAQITVGALLGPDVPQYWQALGCFVDRFTGVEVFLQELLWLFAGLPGPTAQAVFRNTSTERAMQVIRRIADAQKWTQERKAELKPIFDQLEKINNLRNDLLHLGAKFEGEGRWSVSNELLTYTKEKVRTQSLTIATLEAATSDLTAIHLRLTHFAFAEQMPPDTRSLSEASAKQPWRYEPPAGTAGEDPSEALRERGVAALVEYQARAGQLRPLRVGCDAERVTNPRAAMAILNEVFKM
jgi:hypothetical protein